MAISIRRIKEAELSSLFFMVQNLFQFDGISHLLKADENSLREALFSRIPKAHCFVVVLNEQLIGFTLVTVLEHNLCFHTGKTLYIEELYVKPEFRKQGVGKILLKYLAEFALLQGCDRMEWLVVRANSTAIEFYQKLGANPLELADLYRLEGKKLTELAKK